MSTSSAAPVPVTPAAVTMEPAAVDQQQPLPVDSLHTCRYPSKKCWNARALKRNGEMHNLCDEHRQKANKNQRRLEQKRKTSKKVVAAKRVRKSRVNAKKNKVAVAALITASNASANATRLARPAKRHQAQAQAQATATAPLSTAASGLVAAAKTVYSQTPSSSSLPPPSPSQMFPVRPNTELPSGFFTELMLTENTLYAKQQQQQQQLDLNLGLMGTMMMPPPHQHQHLQHLHHYLRVPSVTDFLDGDLDSLTGCLDFSTPSFANLIGGCGFTGSSGSASPIDVCDGLGAVAAVNDFWWHSMVAVDPLLDTSALVMNEEIFSFHQY